jgi:hypothetical protein
VCEIDIDEFMHLVVHIAMEPFIGGGWRELIGVEVHASHNELLFRQMRSIVAHML